MERMQQAQSWHPSKQEVAEILRELRPIIAVIAQHDELELALARTN
jgi:hypothetical protein